MAASASQTPMSDPLAEELAHLRLENERLRGSVERLEGLAYCDALTGLRNRRYFADRLDEELQRLGRTPGTALSLLVIDLDGFKLINDARGHEAGDEALAWVAEFLRGQVRSTDVVCRTGGDEFAILLPATGAEGCAVVAGHLRERLAGLLAAGQAPVGFSVGAATAAPGEAAGSFAARADAAMYEEKESRASRRAPLLRAARRTERPRSAVRVPRRLAAG